MAERRGSRRTPGRSVALPEPTEPAITFRGEKVTNGQILRLWREAMSGKQKSRDRILKCRALRRMESESLIQIAPKWARLYPEVADWAQEVLEERETIDANMIARVGVVEPEFTREPLGFLESDDDHAEDCESFLEEWRTSRFGPPIQASFGKLVEDGEHAATFIPSPQDIDGIPDFFEYLDEKALERLDAVQKSEYEKDDKDRRQRYVRKNADGTKKIKSEYDKGNDDKSKAAHDEAVQRYLLHCPATAIRIIPALDCAPIMIRGTGRMRWQTTALIERQLSYVSELQGFTYGWQGMGDRRLVPLAYGEDGSQMRIDASEVGQATQVYRYTAYLLCDDEDGHKRPCVFTTIGGAATWDSTSGNPDDPESVACIDLFDAYKLSDGSCPALDGWPLWSYHFGQHTEDDSPDDYGRPNLWKHRSRIRSIEGNKTSINATVAVSAFTGHYYTPDGRLAEVAPEAVIEQDGELIVPRIPGAGEMEPSAGIVTVAPQTQVGPDAWKQLSADMAALQAATSDQAPAGAGASGSAQLVRIETGQVAKRHVRDGTKEFVIYAGESLLRVLHAIYQRHHISWPIQTTQQKPVGSELRRGRAPLVYDPAWVGDGHFTLLADYPQDDNPVKQDLARSLWKDGVIPLSKVHEAMGEKDSKSLQVEIQKDKMRQTPAYQMKMQMQIAKKTGDRDLVTIIKALQSQQKMTEAGVPGAPNGIPTAALKRQGESGGGGGGGPPIASSIRGGEAAGAMGAANAQAEAQAALMGTG